jgi:steroid delta-isomerase-like uncharacterized protein
MKSNAETIRSIYDDFSRGDLDAILAVISPDMELIDLGIRTTFRGQKGFLEWLDPWEKGAPDGKAYLLNLVAEGDSVATEHVHRGTHTGPFPTLLGIMPASGRRMEVKFAEFFKLKQGKIISWIVYWDIVMFVEQLGGKVTATKE